MSPSEEERVRRLFEETIDLPPAGRAAWLDRQCGAEGALRDAVNGLLAEHQERTGMLDQPLFCPPPRPEDGVWSGRLLNSRYQIERFIARGGMSAVYLATDRHLADRLVIVKFLQAGAPQFLAMKTRFRQEMEALARIEYHAVVGVLDMGETADGVPFLVIEYIDGVTLRSAMEPGPMPAERAAGLIRQIARAVAAAHSKGVLHRDLKPENIMLEGAGTADECVRLIDFGIARLEESENPSATSATQFAGTTPYMAAEQLRGKPCQASDTYAIAVVAYEMLAGRRPFAGSGPIEIYEQQRRGVSWKPLLERGVPEPAVRLIAKQLAFRPEDRSASALDAGEALADALLSPHRPVLSRRRTVAVLAGGTTAAAGAGLFWWTRPRPLSGAQRVIELSGGVEPLEHGFLLRSDIVNRAIYDADATKVEALRLITGDQGGYYHPLQAAQAEAANRLGWKATFEAAAEEGVTCVTVDFARSPAQYAVNVIAVPGQPDLIRLLTGYTPTIHGIEMTLAGPAGARHRYRLAQPVGSQSAELWVDGVKRYSGFAGTTEYLYQRGPEIGVSRYRSARGVGVFWGFRFEIG